MATIADKQADNNFICLGSVAFVAGVAAGVCACIPGPGWVVALAIVAVVAIAAGVGYFKCKAAGTTRFWIPETVAENTKVKGEPALLVSSCMNCPAEGGMVTASETIWEAWGKQALTNLGHLADFAFGFLAGRGAGGMVAGAGGATNGLITRQVLSNLSKQGLKESSKRFGQIFIQTAKKELVSQFNPFGGWKGRNWICNALRGVGLYGAYKQHWDIWTDDEKSLLDKLQASTVGLILDVFAAKGMTFLCFPAGTKVHTEWGLANIESLEEGIKVLTYNEQTGEKEYKPILKTTRRTTPKMCVLELSNGETLRVTPEHRFFNNGKWTPIEEFEIGDLLQTKEDIYLVIENKTIITTLVEVFNLEVEGNENYFVTIDGVLVHNGYNADTDRFTNELPDELASELSDAKRLGIEPTDLSDLDKFDNMINSTDEIKWALLDDGRFVAMPKTVNGTELKHTVLSGGEDVISAGEGFIVGNKNTGYWGELNNNSGHYKPSTESVEAAKDVLNDLPNMNL